MDSHPETPPGADRPGLRELLARVAIDVRPLRSSPPFRRLWAGQAVSYVGSQVVGVAVPYQVYQLTGSTLAVGLVSFVELVPLLTLTLLGGAIADAVDRRRLLLWTEGALLLTGIGFVANAWLDEPRVWALFVLAFLAASFFCLGVGAMRSLTPHLVPPDQIVAASNLNGLYSNLGAVAGPAMAGLLIAAIGLPLTYLLDVVSFGASLVAIWLLPRIPSDPDADRPGLRSVVEGFRYLRGHRVVLASFLVDSNAMVFGMPSALFPAMAEQHFGGGAATVGYLYAAPYGGALVCSLLSGWTSRVRRQGLAVLVAAGLWGAAITVFGLVDSLGLALAFLAVAGGADLISAIFRSAILLTATTESMRGRLAGIEFAQVASAPTLGNVEAGLVASLTSIRFSVVSGGVLCVAGTVVIGLLLPALARYDARAPRGAVA
ncbi:MAG: MFS transporter [Pseudomonadota bacterium]